SRSRPHRQPGARALQLPAREPPRRPCLLLCTHPRAAREVITSASSCTVRHSWAISRAIPGSSSLDLSAAELCEVARAPLSRALRVARLHGLRRSLVRTEG